VQIAIITIGTHGDVQPYVALGSGLQLAGHKVTLATHRTFAGLVERHGLAFTPIAGDMRGIVESGGGLKIVETGHNPVAMMYHLLRAVEPLLYQIVEDCLNACRGADLVLASAVAYFSALLATQKLRKPLWGAFLQPFFPNTRYPMPAFPPLPENWPFRARYNRLTYEATVWLMWLLAGRLSNKIRREVAGFPPLTYRLWRNSIYDPNQLYLYGYSEQLLPRPPEWPENLHITGYWFLDQQTDWQPPAELLDFLQAGKPPVYIGFGSMSSRDPERVTDIVLNALRITQQRGVILTGWKGLSGRDLPDHVLRLDFVPHEWLFPQMAAVVHHGGAGTTAAALRAGVPQVIVPFGVDQNLWAHQAHKIGVASRPIPRRRLTAERLAAAIAQSSNDPAMRQRASAISQHIQAEDGIARTVEMIEALFRIR
jgi:sterol 3beta-glucosyltransferase